MYTISKQFNNDLKFQVFPDSLQVPLGCTYKTFEFHKVAFLLLILVLNVAATL